MHNCVAFINPNEIRVLLISLNCNNLKNFLKHYCSLLVFEKRNGKND